MYSSWQSGIARVGVMPMSASGEISSPEQWFDFISPPLAGGFATRLDQRVFVTGSQSGMCVSFAMSPDGTVDEVDRWGPSDGIYSASGLRFHPSGRSLVSGVTLSMASIEASGELQGPARFAPDGGIPAAGPGVSPDGRIAVTTWDFDGNGIHWGVFSLTPSGPVLLHDNFFNFGYADIAFIPPRTEEVLGDANADCVRDAADVVTYINHLNDDPDVGGPLDPTITGPVPRARADADQDGDIDADDLAWLVDFLVGGETP